MMHNDFAAFILTHGRPRKVKTYNTLRRRGYTGKIFLIVDNEDQSLEEYKRVYGDEVVVFDKKAVAEYTDSGDNFQTRRGVIYARNACFDIAKQLGVKYFIELDDDYGEFHFRMNNRDEWRGGPIKNLDAVFSSLLDFFINTPITTVAMAQGGDFIGGNEGKPTIKRKAMNSFICGVDRPFRFPGRINEDVNAYVTLGSMGKIFLTIMRVSLNQTTTQSSRGGMTELYLDNGTYVKSFYSVIYHPSGVIVTQLKDRKNPRLHHKVRWRVTVPCILEERYRQAT